MKKIINYSFRTVKVLIWKIAWKLKLKALGGQTMAKYKAGDKFVVEIDSINNEVCYCKGGFYLALENIDDMERYRDPKDIPDCVRVALRERANSLLEQVKQIEAERDAILDFIDAKKLPW